MRTNRKQYELDQEPVKQNTSHNCTEISVSKVSQVPAAWIAEPKNPQRFTLSNKFTQLDYIIAHQAINIRRTQKRKITERKVKKTK